MKDTKKTGGEKRKFKTKKRMSVLLCFKIVAGAGWLYSKIVKGRKGLYHYILIVSQGQTDCISMITLVWVVLLEF
ncbi:hypothetical protein P168DRAFT_164254 [Aspergillus campestris IBT 28561]|uniref:Uncharacterized protein n=1 Tax=Aspergillus campestris (strain IBT 28561) TaxID=1392248 RepID=A0A2I1D0Y2_ASPC2|nr:uncharacterized protein P168DRAFT_164254 [Aspergillus campestris IBT 28561]PKY03530.1 hypothetical protein P168DRAFT_164254 [Aspergillus campestris IBT 28561]